MKFIEIMDNPFPKEIKTDWHHVNNFFVIPIPTQTHLINSGRQTIHRKKCNNILNNWNMNIPISDGSACT